MAIIKSNESTKDGRQWFFKVYKNGKQYKSKKYLTKKEAQEEEALFILKRDNPKNKLFSLIAKDYFNELYKIRKESTVYSYENAYLTNIEPFLGAYYINNITIRQIVDWKEKVTNKGFKLSYLNKLYNILKSIFDFAMKNYEFQSNPVSIVGRFQEKSEKIIIEEEKLRYITFDEFEKLISCIDNNMWKTFFIFLYYTGMRKGEVQALNWNDIDFINNEIVVNKTLSVKTKIKTKIKLNNIETSLNYKITSTKNNQNRKIKMNKTLKDTMEAYKKEVMKYSDFNNNWFVFGNTRFLAQTTIDNKRNEYFKIAELKPITIHEFRHSHVSLLINEYVRTSRDKNMKIDTAKFFLMMSNRMGHTIDVMQKTYMHLFPTIQDEIVDLLDNL